MSRDRFDGARSVANAVLYEGYVLYPYRASAAKNQYRFQFGVVSPKPDASDPSAADESAVQVECLVERAGTGRPCLDVRLRFLQLQAPIAGSRSRWDEGIEHEVDLPRIDPVQLLEAEERLVIALGDLEGTVTVAATAMDDLIRVRVRLENTGAPIQSPHHRSETLRRSFISAHFLLAVAHASFVAPLDSSPERSAALASCVNQRLWPVPVGKKGSHDLMLAAPIILPEYPEISPESRVEFCDGTEIDELLTLSVTALTDEEKREARATDPRARAIIDAVDVSLFEAPLPEDEWIEIAGTRVEKGSLVRLQPAGGADAMDMFLTGRQGHVTGVFRDVDGRTHVAVTVDDDPGADVRGGQGRFFYFSPEEIQPIGRDPADAEQTEV